TADTARLDFRSSWNSCASKENRKVTGAQSSMAATKPVATCLPERFMNRRAISLSDRKSTRLNSSHVKISYAVFCLKKKNTAHRYSTFFFLLTRRPPSSTRFPYTTLFRSHGRHSQAGLQVKLEFLRQQGEQEGHRRAEQHGGHEARRYLLARALHEQARDQPVRSEEHTSELQSRENLVCRLLLEKKKYCAQILHFFFFTDAATAELYTLSLHDALPISRQTQPGWTSGQAGIPAPARRTGRSPARRAAWRPRSPSLPACPSAS